MGKFKQSLITTAGKSILLGGEVTYTSAKLFSQDVSSMTDDQVRALTALTGQLMSVGVSVEVMDNSTVSVKAVFSNKGLTDDLTFSSVGWFAKAGSGTEALIAVTPIEGTKLLCAGLPNSSTDAINIAMNMAIGDSTTVNVVIDPAGTVSPVDLGSAISKIQTDVDTKATKADVDKEITSLTADKANSADVYTKSDVDSALAADRGRLGKLEGVQTVDSPDFNNITNTGVYYITNNTPANLKNNPVSQWGVLVVSSGNGQRISQVYYPDDDSPQWCRLLNGSNWLPWYELSNQSDITNLQNTVNSKVNVAGPLYREIKNSSTWNDIFGVTNPNNVLTSLRIDPGGAGPLIGDCAAGIGFGGVDTKSVLSVDYEGNLARITAGNGDKPSWSEDIAWKSDITNLQNQVDSKTSGTVVTAYDVASKKPTTETKSYTSEELVDQGALSQFADQINQLKGRQKVDAPDFNTLTDSGVYMITSPDKGKNIPSTDNGTLAVFNGNGIRIAQIYFEDSGPGTFVRTGWLVGAVSFGNWNQIAWTSDITNLQNQIQAQQTKLTDDVYTKSEVDSKVSALNQALTPVYVNSRDDVAAQDAYIVIVDDDN